MSAERRIQDQQQATLDIGSVATAFHATHISNKGRGRGRNTMSPFGSRSSNTNFGRGFYHNRASSNSGPGRGTSSGSSILGPYPSSSGGTSHGRPPCQICGRLGHSAIDCYNRLNLSFEGRVPTKKLSAMAASTSTPSASTWLLDSGANTHVTTNLGNLNNPKEYRCTDHIDGIGNNSGLSISHVGSSILNTNSHSFLLSDTLYCPNIGSLLTIIVIS